MTTEAWRRSRRRVVVTGCGAITPIGLTVPDFWAALLAGRSGVGPVAGVDADDLPVRIAGEVRDFDPLAHLPRTLARRLDPFAQYALAAAAEAARTARLAGVDPDRIGTVIGSGYGSCTLLDAARRALDARGARAVGPYVSVAGAIDNAPAEVSRWHQARGPSVALSTACATGTTAIGEAARLIQLGLADAVLAGGADASVTRLDLAAAASSGALSRRNDEPERASRPFDRDRDGFVMSAGAGVVVLEAAETARRRGVPILAEVIGYGATTDAHHPTAPHPEGRGAVAAMRQALADAGIDPADIDHVNAHGTGTQLNDRTEAAAIRAVFGDHAARIPISAIKSMTGHMIGAAGAVEFIATVQAIRTGLVPPTINCDDPEDPDLDFVAHRPRQHPVRTAMSNSFGFGGHNAVLVLRAWEPTA